MAEDIVVFTGAGISAESGLRTFRDMDGYWNEHRIEDVATPEGYAANPALVLEFYNQRRREVRQAQPNAAHLAIAQLQQRHRVTVITQNIDDLHERAGSRNVIHVHGEITKGQSSVDDTLIVPLQGADIALGDLAPDGSQLRPHVVWFGEAVLRLDEALEAICQADRVLVVGTSLSVFPVAALVQEAPAHAEKVLIALEMQRTPAHYHFLQGRATDLVPPLVAQWLP
ncbi:NAD-dependent deacylase [Allofranklinella schreckenbergeri]|uniref:NAD-dependent protein deacylase n=1 Tax=Allofranklinella schreckenbergeri TaxID=1076744 RepID=A0A3M6QEH5_9BURK|nr:NAD-dependent deacylase [Allofranklinella schreckenbergeri]RMX01514.1 NAD-dependent deacylase [Allofranklinella schreckenbergeri]RMX01708.1 NAD-dependent deacylase [Allofranklinella schreckenbergeri]RRD40832.1 NAD-dependent deacylase [Comamonadaceae bacterium OH3737_COT-264]